jgi:hypothetical protein
VEEWIFFDHPSGRKSDPRSHALEGGESRPVRRAARDAGSAEAVSPPELSANICMTATLG